MMASNAEQLEADYLIIGAGASGVAFADELIRHTKDITVIIIDRHSTPGGHWNDAYNFVTLHQPATFYGVNSKQLGKGGRELATFAEINAYYELVVHELLSTGRVKFFPLCEYKGNGVFHSLLAEGKEYKVHVHKKTVDATYIGPDIPLTHTPNFEVSHGVNFVPVNEISHNRSPWNRYLIIGGGKTGADAILFLLNKSVDPDAIVWVVPNDTWYFNRNNFFPDTWVDSMIKALGCFPDQTSYKELFLKLEEVGFFLRIDTKVEPIKFKGGTIAADEVESLKRVKNVVRNKRIRRIEQTRIIFVDGTEMETDKKTLHVDCSANGSSTYTPRQVFDGQNIVIQDVKITQTPYSAAVIGIFEGYFPDDEEKKNKILKPIYRHQTPWEYVICLLQELHNDTAISNTLGFDYIRKSRLHALSHVSQLDCERFMDYVKLNGEKVIDTLTKMVEIIENEKKEKSELSLNGIKGS